MFVLCEQHTIFNVMFLAALICFCNLITTISATISGIDDKIKLNACKNLSADIILIVDISSSRRLLNTMVLNRTFLQTIINQFPISKDTRMSLVTLSAECRTMIKLEEGVSHKALLRASNMPFFPLWGFNLNKCLAQVGSIDDRGYSTRATIVVILMETAPTDNTAQTAEIVQSLEDNNIKTFAAVTNAAAVSEINSILGKDRVIEVIREHEFNDDNELAIKLANGVCTRTCSTKKIQIAGCKWNVYRNVCTEQVKWEPLRPSDSACKTLNTNPKEEICPLKVCLNPCDNYKWSLWGECCDGEKTLETFVIKRKRDVLPDFYHPTLCPREEFALVKNDQLESKKAQVRFMTYVICLSIVLLLAIIGVTCLCTTRRLSKRKLERRLRAAGVGKSLKEMANDETMRAAMSDLSICAKIAASGEETESAASGSSS